MELLTEGEPGENIAFAFLPLLIKFLPPPDESVKFISTFSCKYLAHVELRAMQVEVKNSAKKTIQRMRFPQVILH